MKVTVTLLLCVAAAMAYDDVNDNSLVKLLNNDKKLKEFFGCVVDVNPCDELGTRSKTHIVEILSDDCSECDYTQKHYTHAFIVKLRNDYPDLYEKFEEKYDPSRELLKKLDEDMMKYS